MRGNAKIRQKLKANLNRIKIRKDGVKAAKKAVKNTFSPKVSIFCDKSVQTVISKISHNILNWALNRLKYLKLNV